MTSTSQQSSQNKNSGQNQNKKSKKAKKFYVNKIININYKKEKKPKTKSSGFQTKWKTHEKGVQSNPDFMPDQKNSQPKLHDFFSNFLNFNQASGIFDAINFFVDFDDEKEKNIKFLETGFDKQTFLRQQFGNFFHSRTAFNFI